MATTRKQRVNRKARNAAFEGSADFRKVGVKAAKKAGRQAGRAVIRKAVKKARPNLSTTARRKAVRKRAKRVLRGSMGRGDT